MGHGGHIVRIRYGKLGSGKYISHLDTIRGAERSLRRMGLPLLYSEGFTPRPRMSFAAALQVGVSSVAEHMDVFLTQLVSPEDVVKAGMSAFHESMPIIAAGSFDGSYSLPAKVEAAVYEIRPYRPGMAAWGESALRRSVDMLMAMESITVAGKEGKTKEARSLILDAKAREESLTVSLACGNKNLRPQEFIGALAAASGEDFGISQDICRIGLLLGLGSGLADPMTGCESTYYSERFRS